MIKRPVSSRFNQRILERFKITTIRDRAWPVGKPIMLYNWSGLPYRSKQIDVAAVMVEMTMPIEIHVPEFGSPSYSPRFIDGRPIWSVEGFHGRDDMDEWFYRVVRKGTTAVKHLMKFRLLD